MDSATGLPRRLALGAALILAAGGATIAVAPSVQAIPIGCSYQASDSVDPGVSVTGYVYLVCQGKPSAPQNVTLRQGGPVGTVVAQGFGSATYDCNGSAVKTYTVSNGGAPFQAACG